MVLRDGARFAASRGTAGAHPARPLSLRTGGDGATRRLSRSPLTARDCQGAGVARAQESLDAADGGGVGAVLRRHDGRTGILCVGPGALLPARPSAVARDADSPR